jgi:hypothetical protein
MCKEQMNAFLSFILLLAATSIIHYRFLLTSAKTVFFCDTVLNSGIDLALKLFLSVSFIMPVGYFD